MERGAERAGVTASFYPWSNSFIGIAQSWTPSAAFPGVTFSLSTRTCRFSKDGDADPSCPDERKNIDLVPPCFEPDRRGANRQERVAAANDRLVSVVGVECNPAPRAKIARRMLASGTIPGLLSPMPIAKSILFTRNQSEARKLRGRAISQARFECVKLPWEPRSLRSTLLR